MNTKNNLTIDKWDFDASIGKGRIEALKIEPSFDQIADAILSEMRVVCGEKDRIRKHPIDGYRVVYSIEVSRPTFDLFFNSINGYRSWYFRSPEAGVEKIIL